VDVYYTLDGVDPTATSYRYSGVPVIVSSSATPVTLKARGIDMAGNLGPVASSSYSFMAITSVRNLNPVPPDPPNAGRQGTYPVIRIEGYGFDPSDAVIFLDSHGVQVPLAPGFVPSVEPARIGLVLDLTLGAATGWGHVEIALAAPDVGTATFPFEILPAPP
jgi:hypothetical protein